VSEVLQRRRIAGPYVAGDELSPRIVRDPSFDRDPHERLFFGFQT